MSFVIVLFAGEAKCHLPFVVAPTQGAMAGLEQQRVLVLDVGLDHFRVVEGERQRVKDLCGSQLRVTLQNRFDFGAVAEKGINAPNGHT